MLNKKIPCVIPESKHQEALVQWMELKNILYYHIPNEGKRTKWQAVFLKKIGLKPGVPDICIAQARKGYNGFYIEMKTDHGRITKEQSWWLDRLTKENYKTYVAYGFDDAKKSIEEYFN